MCVIFDQEAGGKRKCERDMRSSSTLYALQYLYNVFGEFWPLFIRYLHAKCADDDSRGESCAKHKFHRRDIRAVAESQLLKAV